MKRSGFFLKNESKEAGYETRVIARFDLWMSFFELYLLCWL
jgi:hypothetical protein